MASSTPFSKICVHCGAEGVARIGYCTECGEIVCERCGDTHLSMGKSRVIHHSCLRTAGESTFSMIRFVQ
jgi:hypothetical protein